MQAERIAVVFGAAALKIGDYDINAVEAPRQPAALRGASLHVSLPAGGDPMEDFRELKKSHPA